MDTSDDNKENIHVLKKHKSDSVHSHKSFDAAITNDVTQHNTDEFSTPPTDSKAQNATKYIQHTLHNILRYTNTLKTLDFITLDLDRGRTVAYNYIVKRSELTDDTFDPCVLLRLRDRYINEAFKFTELLHQAIESLSQTELHDVYNTVKNLKDVKGIGKLRREYTTNYYNEQHKCTRMSMLQFLTDVHIHCRTEYINRLYKYSNTCLTTQSMQHSHKIVSYLLHLNCMQWERCTAQAYVDGSKYSFYWFKTNKETVYNAVQYYWDTQQTPTKTDIETINDIEATTEQKIDKTDEPPLLQAVARTSSNAAAIQSPTKSQSTTTDTANTQPIRPVKTVFELCQDIDTSLASVLTNVIDYQVASVHTTAVDSSILSVKLKLERTLAARLYTHAPITPHTYSNYWPAEKQYTHDQIPESDNDDMDDSEELSDIEDVEPPKPQIITIQHVYIDKILPENFVLKDDHIHKKLIQHMIPDIDTMYNHIDGIVPVRLPQSLIQQYNDDAKDNSDDSRQPEHNTPTNSETDKSTVEPTIDQTDKHDTALSIAMDIDQADNKATEQRIFVEATQYGGINELQPIIEHVGYTIDPFLSLLMTREQRRIKNIQFTALLSYICKSFGLDEQPPDANLTNSKYQKYMASCATIANQKIFIGKSIITHKIQCIDTNSYILQNHTVAPPADKVILGLFAGRDFKANEVICRYGGVKEHGNELIQRWKHIKTTNMLSHARKIPQSEYVRDGRLWAAAFDRSRFDSKHTTAIVDNNDVSQSPQPMDSPIDIQASPSASPVDPMYTFDDVKLDGSNNTNSNTIDLLDDNIPNDSDDDTYNRATHKVIPSFTPIKLLELMYQELLAGVHINKLSNDSRVHTGEFNNNARRARQRQLNEVEQLHVALHNSLIDTHPDRLSMHYNAFIDDIPYYNALQQMCVELNNMLLLGGTGYMSNTSRHRSKMNVRCKECNPSKYNNVLMCNELFYIATCDIKKYDEIIAPYGNNESKQFGV